MRIQRLQRLEPALRHREGIVREVDPLLLLVPLVHREIDDPAEARTVLVDETELLADAGARGAGEAWRTSPDCRPTKKTASPAFEAELRADGASVRSGPMFLAIGPAPTSRPRPREEDVAQARLPLALRPGVHAVAEGAAAAARRGNRPDLDALIAFSIMRGEDLEAGAARNARSRPASRSGCADPACRCRICASRRR